MQILPVLSATLKENGFALIDQALVATKNSSEFAASKALIFQAIDVGTGGTTSLPEGFHRTICRAQPLLMIGSVFVLRRC